MKTWDFQREGGASLANGEASAKPRRQKKSRPKAASAVLSFADYCGPTDPENAPFAPFAWTSLFPNVNSAPPLPKLRPAPLPVIVAVLARTVTLGPRDRIPKAFVTDVVFL